MNPLRLALRNVVRNYRRSLMTVLALAVGTMAVLLFSGYVQDTVRGLQTATVRSTGHLQVMTKGYLQFGRGNPGRFAIRDYDAVTRALRNDVALLPLIAVITPVLDVDGIASNAGTSTTTSFSGVGVVPTDYARQLSWDGFDINMRPATTSLDAARAETGVIGQGLAQILGLCKALKVEDCRELAAPAPATTPAAALPADIAALGQAVARADRGGDPASVSVDLLASTASGNPNVVRMTVGEVKRQAIREIDAMFVAVPLSLAQRLVFGPGERGASAVVVQLKQTDDLPAARARVEAVLGQRFPGLEVVSFEEISSTYTQIVQNYSMIFAFIAVLIAIITLFSIANAINMAVSERTAEIGTLRALGFQRGAIRAIFVSEGAMLGLIGTVLGVVLAIVVGDGIINAADLSWVPPGRSSPVPIRVEILATQLLIPATIAGLTVMAVLSAIIPAARAARLNITEAFAMRNPFLLLATGVAALLAAGPAATTAPAIDAQRLLAAADGIRNPPGSFSVRIDLKEYRDRALAASSALLVYSRPNGDTGQFDNLLKFVAPARDADKLMLRSGKDLWFYDRSSKISVRIAPQARLLGQASNGDVMATSLASSYKATLAGNETVSDGAGKQRQTARLDLVSARADATYAKASYWIDPATSEPVKAEFRTSEGQLLKTAFFRQFRPVLGKSRPTETVIIDGVNPNWVTVLTSSAQTTREVPRAWLQRDFLPRFDQASR